MDKQLKELKNQYKSDIPTHFTDHDKQAVLQKIKQTKQIEKTKRKSFFPLALTAFALVAVVFVSIIIFDGTLRENIASKSDKNASEDSPMTARSFDHESAEISSFSNDIPNLEKITPTKSDILVNWSSDNMDRGNHEYDSSVHGSLVVRDKDTSIERGDVIYFEIPEFSDRAVEMELSDQQISRIVGLPGETIEIKQGQVYIDGKPLDTFYAKATVRGMHEDEYFNTVPDDQSNGDHFKEYFTMDMSPVEIEENSVFVLGDQWWRSIDSKEFGPLPIHDIIGKVVGYEK